MKKILPRKRSLRILTLLGALILFLGISYAGARHVAWPCYKAWREDRANNIARDYLAKGDYPNALVAVRKTLGYNPRNIEAWKLAVEITEKQDSPQAIYYQQRLASAQPTLENKLKHLRLAVKYRAYANALEAIEKSGPEVAKSPEFFELAATVAQHANDPLKAKYYLINLLTLQPSNNKARLDLAQIRLADDYEGNKAAIRSEIETIASTDPALRIRALGVLLADAVDTKNTADALPLAGQLANSPGITPQIQLLIADAYRIAAPERAAPYIAQLEKNAGTLEKILPLANYLIRHDQPAEARRWIETLPAELRSHEKLQLAYAFALHTLKDTAALETYLRDIKWTDDEFIRHALLARAYRQRSDLRASNEAWRLALIEAGNSPARLQFLLAQTNAWGWPDQKYEVLWKKFALDPADKTTRAQIAAWEYSKGNTANLNRLFARISEYDPADRDARNNYNYTSLILNLNTDRATRDAEALYASDPGNAYYATTYALSLCKNDKPRDALRIINTLGAAALMIPERALIRAVILITNGRIDEGLDQVAQVKLDRLLPEERRLYAETAPLVAKARRDAASAARLAAFTPASSASIERKSWLAPLPAPYRENATVQMELADNLYATDDYNGLAETLRSDRWERNDFLRQALLAYAQRNLHRDIDSRATWRIALGAAGPDTANLAVLENLCERWGWTAERIETQNRIIQRDPADRKNFADLADYYTKNGQTSELARIYALLVDSGAGDADSKIRLAYYSLLTDTNIARAHVLAKEVYDSAPANPDAAKVYAFSLLKQSRPAEGWRIIAAVPADHAETGIAQACLLKAALAVRQNDPLQASAQLVSFDPKGALPEEIALADTLKQSIATAKNS